MRTYKPFLLVILSIMSHTLGGQVFLTEGFENGTKPDGWTEEAVSGNEPWRYRNGGHSPNDNNWLIPAWEEDLTRNPDGAYEGTYNAIFFKQGDNNEKTKLITPELDLSGTTSVELSFYLCQIPWTFEGSTGWDVLRVFYKTSAEGEWILLHEYLDRVYEWELQTLNLPEVSSTYYIAFEGHTRWGYGTCIDNVVVEEKGFQSLYIGEMNFQQPFELYEPSGIKDLPVMRVDFKVYGNTDEAILNNISFTSLNTDDSDILTGGIHLYSTTTQTFSKDNLLGSASGFTAGKVNFTSLNHSLPPGSSYLWLTFDVDTFATHGNILDVMVAANDIFANDTLYPLTDQSPVEFITIYETQYIEDFEGIHNWVLSGEFEVGIPNGMGGSPGNPNPESAFSGIKCLGTDLTGLGDNHYNYEPGLGEAESYLATSPVVDVFYYTNLNLFFERKLNIEVWDNASILVSPDDGLNWSVIWESESYLGDFQWTAQMLPVPEQFARTDKLRMRFKLGPTDGDNNYSGWNIDDVYLTGEFISRDVGVSSWYYPQSGSGHSSSDSVMVYVRNYGGATITDDIPLAYSFDGGLSLIPGILTEDIPVGDSVLFTFPAKVDLSEPGLKTGVFAVTNFPDDQFNDNDTIYTEVYVTPTYPAPYSENFESGEGFWTTEGDNLWEYGTPSGTVINSASSGTSCWVTGVSQKYSSLVSELNQIIYEDDFETDNGWTFKGEFERKVPSNMHVPYFAYSGYYCIGTDISGQGPNPFLYEYNISEGNPYEAVSPTFDVSGYSNLKVSFATWVRVSDGDSIRFEVSPDNGISWVTIWKNSGGILDEDFHFEEYSIPDSLSYSTEMKFRFSMFYSSSAGTLEEGWIVDDFLLKGDLLNFNAGYLRTPSFDLTGLAKPVMEFKMWTDTESGIDGMTLYYTINDGDTWVPVTNASGFESYWNWYTGNNVASLGRYGWSGQSGGWITVRHLLPGILIGKKDVQFRFEFRSDKFNNDFDGIAFDDFRILDAPDDISILEIVDPVTSCYLDHNQTFILRLDNTGLSSLAPGDTINIGYRIDKGGEILTAIEKLKLTTTLYSGVTKDISFNTEFDFWDAGDYQTEIYLIEPEPYFYYDTSNDTINRLIQVNKPYVDLGPDIATVHPDTVVLNAYSGIPDLTYTWQDSSPDSILELSAGGTYFVEVMNSLGCKATDTVVVLQLIADLGISSITSPVSSCELGDEIISVWIKNFGTDTLELDDTIYISSRVNGGALLNDTLLVSQRFFPGDSIGYSFSEAYDFSIPGSYNLTLFTRHIDDFTDINDTLSTSLTVYGYPAIDLGPDLTVESAEHLLEPGTGFVDYLWQDGSTEETFLVEEEGKNLYFVDVGDVNGCYIRDSVYITLNVTDLEIDQVLSPETSCNVTESVTVSLRIRNSGNITISSGSTVNIHYTLDSGIPVDGSHVLSADLLPGNTFDYSFAQAEAVTLGNWYDFLIYLDMTGDMREANDTVFMPVGIFDPPVVDLGEDFQAIIATEYLLDAGAGYVSYIWNDGSTEQTFLMTEPGIHTYSVTVTDANGCEGYDDIQIMLAVPDIGIDTVFNPVTACEAGENEVISVQIKNYGNWNVSQSADINIGYSVNGGPAIIEDMPLEGSFVSESHIVYNFNTPGDFSQPGHYELLVFTEYNSDLVPGNDSMLIEFDIFGNPFVSLADGSDTVVVYGPSVISATPGYPLYLWQNGNTGNEFPVNTAGAGNYNVTVTDTNGCKTTEYIHYVYDEPDLGAQSLTSPVSSCEPGSSSTISVAVVNNGYYRLAPDEALGLSYSVDGQDPVNETVYTGTYLIPGASTDLVFQTPYDFSASGTYQILVNLSFDADTDNSNNSIDTEINTWSNPTVEIGDGQDTIRANLPVVLEASPGFTDYYWQNGSGSMNLSAGNTGLYWVRVSDVHGCTDTDSVYILNTTGIEPSELQGKISIYPNPAIDFIMLVLGDDVHGPLRIEITNTLGKTIMMKEFKESELKERRIETDWMEYGLYFLKVSIGKETYVLRFVKS